MPDRPVKPLRLLPAPGTYVLGWLFILLSAALTVMALAARSGLLILFISFMLAGRIALNLHHRHKNKQQAAKEARKAASASAAPAPAAPISGKAPEGEVYAAIAMALYELQANVHDVESNVLTI